MNAAFPTQRAWVKSGKFQLLIEAPAESESALRQLWNEGRKPVKIIAEQSVGSFVNANPARFDMDHYTEGWGCHGWAVAPSGPPYDDYYVTVESSAHKAHKRRGHVYVGLYNGDPDNGLNGTDVDARALIEAVLLTLPANEQPSIYWPDSTHTTE
jgi:hypothetical protein